jgi:hypothetical protein
VTDSAYSPVSACSSGDTVTVSSGGPLAAGAITPSSPSIDSGQSITLTANPSGGTPPYTYQWYTGASCTSPISGATAATYSASPASAMTYYYRVTDSAFSPSTACSAGDTVAVNTALVAGAITPSAPVIDGGQAVTLAANPSGGTTPYSYQWYTGAGCASPISGATSPTYSPSPSSTSTYYYKVTDSSSAGATSACSAGDTVTVNPALSAGAITPSTPTIDNGQTVTLSANPSGGTPSYSYQWYTGAACTTPISGATSSIYSASPTSSTTYHYQVTDSAYSPASACSAADTVNVNPALSAGAITPSSPTIDSGQSITLSANPASGTTPYSFQWYTGAGCTSPIAGATSSTYSASPTSATTYYYKVTDSAYAPASQCSLGDTVTVNAALNAGAITPSSPTIDNGQSVTLTANPNGGTSPYGYQWYTGASCASLISGTTSPTYAASPSATTTYSYRVTDSSPGTPAASACSAGDIVGVSPALAAGAISPASPTIDNGQTISLTANPSGGTGSLSYQWYTGAACTSPIPGASSNTYSASPTSSATYYYRVTDLAYSPSSVCSPGDLVSVNPALSAGAIGPSGPTIDNGQSITLSANPAGGTGPYSYKWYTGIGCTSQIAGATSSSYSASPSSTTTYYYQVTDSANSPTSQCSAGDAVTVHSALAAGAITPSSPTINSGQSVTLSANPSGGTSPYSYQWYTGATCNTAISGATSSTYSASPATTTTYSYRVTDASQGTPGASACSSGDVVTVNSVLTAGAITASSPAIDSGQSVTLTANPTGGTGPYSYQWYTASGCASPIPGAASSTYVASPSSTSTYYYKVTDSLSATACSAGDTVTVNPALTPPTISASPTSISSGQASTLSTSTSFSGGTSAYMCQWLQEAPGSGSFSGLGSSFACNVGDTPSVSTGALSTAGTWSFELRVADAAGPRAITICTASRARPWSSQSSSSSGGSTRRM